MRYWAVIPSATRFAVLVIAATAAISIAAADEPLRFERVPPTPPERAEATFRCLHGFSMQLLAAEPLVNDPVALEYDEFGRAWVVEMRDYPYTDKSTDKPNVERTTDAPLGRVRILEDTDGDGRFDRSDIFAEDLSWPTGIALWKGGCYQTLLLRRIERRRDHEARRPDVHAGHVR
jgi:glucose/arabinose dehydrogenase